MSTVTNFSLGIPRRQNILSDVKHQVRNQWRETSNANTATIFYLFLDRLDPAVPTIVVGAVAGVAVFAIVLFLVWRYVKKQNQDNNNNGEGHDNDEEQPILANGAGGFAHHPNIIHNPFEEWNAANQARPRPIGSSYTKADANVIRIVRAWGSANVLNP